MDIHVRGAVAQDADRITSLMHAWAKENGEQIELTADYVRRYLGSTSGILLAESGQQTVGLLSYSFRPDLWHAAPCCYIEELYVTAESRGGGAGTALLAELLALAKQKGTVEISITVMPDNVSAQRLYRRMGLVEEALSLEKHFLPQA